MPYTNFAFVEQINGQDNWKVHAVCIGSGP